MRVVLCGSDRCGAEYVTPIGMPAAHTNFEWETKSADVGLTLNREQPVSKWSNSPVSPLSQLLEFRHVWRRPAGYMRGSSATNGHTAASGYLPSGRSRDVPHDVG
jgi:hypothetical protein